MVLSGGVNIYPADEYGESLAAHVDVDPGAGLIEDDIMVAVRKELAGYKVPRRVAFDDQLPRDDSGKLLKRRLREKYWTATDSVGLSNGSATIHKRGQIAGETKSPHRAREVGSYGCQDPREITPA